MKLRFDGGIMKKDDIISFICTIIFILPFAFLLALSLVFAYSITK